MSKELAKAYEPREVEDRIYDFWLQGGYFHAEVDPEKKPYTIVIPPPNITGQLHMGHALDETIQDILIRFKRMQGYSALWLPGTDHASIATEAKIVEAMKKEGLTKEDVGREGFLERAWDWKAKFGGRIVEQLKKLGIDYYMLTGSVNKEKRMQMVDSFNKDDVPVFCISLKAGGTGLNLTAADIVIHYDPWWNVAVQNQATDRAHRIGQKNVVTVYKLVSQGTIEEKIIDIQEKKKKLAEQVLEGEGMDSVVFTKEEIMELLG